MKEGDRLLRKMRSGKYDLLVFKPYPNIHRYEFLGYIMETYCRDYKPEDIGRLINGVYKG